MESLNFFYFFSKCSNFNVDFKDATKRQQNVFGFLDNCVWIGNGKFSVLSVVNVLKDIRERNKISLARKIPWLKFGKLAWKEHIKYNKNNIVKKLDCCIKLSTISARDTYLMLCYSFIRTYISYGNIALGSTNRTNLKKINSQQ